MRPTLGAKTANERERERPCQYSRCLLRVLFDSCKVRVCGSRVIGFLVDAHTDLILRTFSVQMCICMAYI